MASTTILSDNGVSSGSAGLKSTAGNDGVLILQTTTSGGTATNAVTINTLQNVGIVTTQSTWDSGYKALEIAQGVSLWGSTTVNFTSFSNNVLFDGAYKYKNNGYAGQYSMGSNGAHTFYSMGTGTAGAALTLSPTLSWNKDTTLTLQGGSSSSGTGIAFPATQSASSDANTLDDYEEGTFTCILTGSSSNPTGVTYFSQDGKYTKVGNLVTIFFYCGWTTYTGGSGTIRIAGLPYAAVNATAGGYSPGAVETSYITYPSGYTYCVARTTPNQTYVDVQTVGTSVPWTALLFSNMSSGASQKEVLGCVTYFTST